jgi:hypothetical protein
VVDEKEKEFLTNFSKHLGFFEEDLEDSMIALEGFIVENWGMIGELQSRKNLEQIGGEYEHRVSKLLAKNSKTLSHEIQQNEGILRLLQKYKAGEISPEDDARLQDQLITLLEGLPSLSSQSLPRNFLTTASIIRMLPAAVLDEDEEKK